MKILQIYDHIGINSGVTTVIMNWFRNLDHNKIQFDFLVGYYREVSFEAQIQELGGNVFYMSDSNTFGVKQLPGIIQNVKKFMKEHAKDYDAVHLHTSTFSYPYLYYAKKYGVKRRICHIHGAQLGGTPFVRWRNACMVLPLKFLANEFVACSQNAVEKYCPFLKLKNVTVILNSVDFSKYKYKETDRSKIRASLGIDEKTFLAAHISNMAKIKNVPFVVQIFAKIVEKSPDSKLLLAGRTPLPDDVQKQIYKYGLEDNVISLGVRPDVSELMFAADVCLMPSQTEGFGLAAVECQIAGTPVLTSPGFPTEVYASDLAVQLKLDEDLWAENALIQERKSPACGWDTLKRFDSAYIAEQVSNYYMSR